MPARYPIQKVLAHCRQILSLWALKQDMSMPGLDSERLREMSEELESRIAALAALESKVIAERHEVNLLADRIADECARVRHYARGFYGPDSAEVKMAGLTRRSERKPRRRKP